MGAVLNFSKEVRIAALLVGGDASGDRDVAVGANLVVAGAVFGDAGGHVALSAVRSAVVKIAVPLGIEGQGWGRHGQGDKDRQNNFNLFHRSYSFHQKNKK